MRKIAGLLLVVLALSSCAAITASMEKWQGQHVSNLIASWGPPDRTYSDGRGGTVVVYLRERGFYTPATSRTYTRIDGSIQGNMVYGAATTYTVYTPEMLSGYTAHRTFWVDKYGRITGYSWKGL